MKNDDRNNYSKNYEPLKGVDLARLCEEIFLQPSKDFTSDKKESENLLRKISTHARRRFLPHFKQI